MRIIWRLPECTDPEIVELIEGVTGNTLAVEWELQTLSAYLFAIYLTVRDLQCPYSKRVFLPHRV